jgi:hypothetical protein
MTIRHSILTAVAALAVAAPAAQAHLLVNDGAVTSKTSISTQSALSAMTAAGIRYHAQANYKNERFVSSRLGSGTRPDDRAGMRGV